MQQCDSRYLPPKLDSSLSPSMFTSRLRVKGMAVILNQFHYKFEMYEDGDIDKILDVQLWIFSGDTIPNGGRWTGMACMIGTGRIWGIIWGTICGTTWGSEKGTFYVFYNIHFLFKSTEFRSIKANFRYSIWCSRDFDNTALNVVRFSERFFSMLTNQSLDSSTYACYSWIPWWVADIPGISPSGKGLVSLGRLKQQ